MTDSAPCVGELLAGAREALAPITDDASLEAQILLGHVLGRGRAWLVAHPDDVPSAAAQAQFGNALARRCDGEPVAYILGRREFWSLDLEVTPGVLIPRPDTECLVERALTHLRARDPGTLLDAGTGSGAVALALAVERPDLTVLASDRDAAALSVAAGNVARLAPGRVHLFRGDWLAPVAPGSLDIIVSNPPYIAADDEHLRMGDVRFEPRDALVAGRKGLAAIHTLTHHSARCLRRHGWLLVEHGAEQGAVARALLTGNGFTDVATHRDLAGNERVTEGRWPGASPAGSSL